MIARENAKKLLHLFLALTLVLIAYFAVYFIHHLPLEYGTDLRPQWFFFYEEFRAMMKSFAQSRIFPFYSWDSFLGTNFYASKSYYVMGDVFNYLGLLFSRDFFFTAMILGILKFYLAGFAMYFYLRGRDIRSGISEIGALLYAFSGWAVFFSGQLSFLSFYAWMPLYFLAMDRYIRDHRGIGFTVISAVMLLTNYYFFFAISLLSPVYFLYQYYLTNHHLKGWLASCLPLLGYYMLACMCSAVLILPTVYYMAGSSRVGSIGSFYLYDPMVYLHDLVSGLVPNYLYLYQNDIFDTGAHYTREICMYGGILTALIAPQFFSSRDHAFRRATAALYAVLIAILVFPQLATIIHGLSAPSMRWLLFAVFINITVSSETMERQSVSLRNLKITGLVYTAFLLLSIPATALIYHLKLSDYLPQIKLFVLCAAIVWLYIFAIHASAGTRRLKILMILCMIEVGGFGSFLYLKNAAIAKSQDYAFIQNATHVLQDGDNQLNDALNQLDAANASQYYRIYVPEDSLFWNYSYNMPMAYQMNGLMTYDSAFAPSLNKLKELDPSMKMDRSGWLLSIQNGDLMNFLNVKYAIVTKQEELPQGSWKLVTDSFRSSLQIYENESYRPLGTSYESARNYDEFDQLKDLETTVFCSSDDLAAIQAMTEGSHANATLEQISYYGNQLKASYTAETDGFMVITLPYDQGWRIRVDGQQVSTYSVNGGFIGIPVQAGSHAVEMTFVPQGFKAGALVSAGGIAATVLLAVFQSLRRRRKLRLLVK